MTCLQASPISLPALQKPFSFRPAGNASAAQSALTAQNIVPGCDGLLPAGQALTLQARQAGLLRIVQGRAWITFSHADQSLRVPAGDHFCGAGQGLPLAAGDVVVMESWGASDEALARFSWDAACEGSAMTGLVLAGSRLSVLQPLQDLRLALGLAAGAAMRLVQGLVRGGAARVTAILQ